MKPSKLLSKLVSKEKALKQEKMLQRVLVRRVPSYDILGEKGPFVNP